MTCTHRMLDLPDGTPCTLDAHPGNPGGHVYISRDGSSVDDGHEDGGHG